jgi:hypothetical protein
VSYVTKPNVIANERILLALGVYTASEEESDVECDFDGDGLFEESDECMFSTMFVAGSFRLSPVS